MKEYTNLLLEIDMRGVASVTLNRPAVHNAFDATLIAELTRAFEALKKNDAVRLVVISGSGKSFCAGGDINWMRSMKDFTHAENIADASALDAMYRTLRYFSKPLIARVHGVALGGGAGLAAVSDFVVAAQEARFGFTETRLGILPAVISPYAIEKIGVSHARAYFTSGMQFSATEALAMGLVHRVVPAEALAQATEAVVVEFLKAGPKAASSAKALIDRVVPLMGDAQALTALTTQAIAEARVSAEGQEGMDALLNGRNPSWVVK